MWVWLGVLRFSNETKAGLKKASQRCPLFKAERQASQRGTELEDVKFSCPDIERWLDGVWSGSGMGKPLPGTRHSSLYENQGLVAACTTQRPAKHRAASESTTLHCL